MVDPRCFKQRLCVCVIFLFDFSSSTLIVVFICKSVYTPGAYRLRAVITFDRYGARKSRKKFETSFSLFFFFFHFEYEETFFS